MVRTEREAIAVLNEQMTRVKDDVSTLQHDVTAIKQDTTKILESFLTLPQMYITQNMFEQYRREREMMFTSYQKEMDSQLNKMTKRSWSQNTLSAALGVIFGAICAAAAVALFTKGGL